jgi:PEP-CTERM motif
VVQGSTTLASYSGLWVGDASDTVDFSFSAQVGDHFTVLLSAYNGASLNLGRALNGRAEFSQAVNLQGSFTVTAVPEPGSVGLALVGLLVAGLAARRRA